MDSLFIYISQSMKFEKFSRGYFLSWVFIFAGILIYLLFQFFAGFMPRGGFFNLFFQFMGIFLVFTSLLMAYAGVYRITTAPPDMQNITRTAITDTLRRTSMILGVAFIALFLYVTFILIQVGISSLGFIPYAGPVLMALLTGPLFLVNIGCIIAAIVLFAVFPPLVGEVRTMRDLYLEFKISIRDRWLKVAVFTVISFSMLFLCMIVIYFLFQLITGISRAAQGPVGSSYPNFLNAITMRSGMAEIIRSIAPGQDAAASFREMHLLSFELSSLLNGIVGLSYIFLSSLVVAFPLSAFFNLSSIFYGRVRQ